MWTETAFSQLNYKEEILKTMVSIPKQLLIQAILILVNAFFAATEIAVISLNTNKLRKQAEEGDRTASMLLNMSENPAGFLSTIQIGITIAGFLGSAFAANTLADRLAQSLQATGIGLSYATLNNISVVIITIILSFFTLIFGELVPKRVAQQKPEFVARMACKVIRFLAIVMKPFIWLLTACTNGVLALLRLKTDGDDEQVTEDDIRLMVDAGGESGSIEEDEQEWIQNVFEFNDTTVSEVMIRPSEMVAVQESMHNAEILAIIKESGRSRLPVYGEDINDIKGILNTRDFLMNLTDDNMKSISEMMRPAYLVPETIHADKLFSEMQQKKQHLAIVIDEYGQTSGLITLEDLLEEIVGNIYDEFDEEEDAEISKVGDNLWKVSGSLSIDDLNEALGTALDQDELDFDTIGGLVYSQLTEIPKDGTTLDCEAYGLHIHVTKVEDRRISEAMVSVIPPAIEEDETDEKEHFRLLPMKKEKEEEK